MEGNMAGSSKSNVHALSDARKGFERNPGLPWDPDLFGRIRINRSAVERRASTIGSRRSVKKNHQAAWLLKALSCIDLTTLAGDDTDGKVRRLCQKARRPVRRDILAALGVEDLGITTLSPPRLGNWKAAGFRSPRFQPDFRPDRFHSRSNSPRSPSRSKPAHRRSISSSAAPRC